MGNAVEHEGVGRLLESHAFIEPFCIFLCLDIDKCCTETLHGCIDGMKHDLFAIALAPLSGDDPADRNLLHVGSCRAHTRQGDNLVFDSQPQVDGMLVVAVKVLINAVLLDHKDLATYSQQFV